MQDHPEKHRDPVSTASPDLSTAADLAQRAGRLGARLSASANALRLLAASRLAEIRKRISADRLREEAAALAERFRPSGGTSAVDASSDQPKATQADEGGARGIDLPRSAKALRQRAATGLDELRQRTAPPAMLPTWRYVSTLRTRLSLTSADIESLSTGTAQGASNQGERPGPLPSLQEAVAITASVAPLVVQDAAPETPAEQVSPEAPAEQVSSDAARSPHVEKPKAEPTVAADAISRLRNDVLVRTALERPVLTGAAVIALGAVVAALSSAASARPAQTKTPRNRPEDAQPLIGSDGAENSRSVDHRPTAETAQANGSVEADGTRRKNGASKTGDDLAPGGKTRPRRATKPASANGATPRGPSAKRAGSAKSATE